MPNGHKGISIFREIENEIKPKTYTIHISQGPITEELI